MAFYFSFFLLKEQLCIKKDEETPQKNNQVEVVWLSNEDRERIEKDLAEDEKVNNIDTRDEENELNNP